MMKKLLFMLLAVLIAFPSFTACQKTPESPIVVGKDINKLIDSAIPSGSAEQSLAEELQTPERLKMQLVSKGGKLTVNVDASVVLPQAEQMPMIRVGHGHFTQEDAMRYADVLLKGAIPLDPKNAARTKAQIQKAIESLQKLKQSGTLDKYESVQEIDDAIAQLMQEAANAPEVYAPYTHQFQPLSPDNYIALSAALDDTTISSLFAEYKKIEYNKYPERIAALSGILAGPPISNAEVVQKEDLTQETGITPEEALALSMKTMDELEIEGFVCSGQRAFTFPEEGFSIYEFMFTRSIMGIPINYTNDDGCEFDSDAIAPTWAYEKIRIFVDAAGVSYFLYNSPYEIRETVYENVTLLPFPEIQSIFERMVPVVNNFYDEYGRECRMNIHEVKLGLMRITEQNSKDTGLIIPVWDFMGTYEEEGTFFDDAYTSLLTINAVDGSIIDRGLGY